MHDVHSIAFAPLQVVYPYFQISPICVCAAYMNGW